MIEYTLPEFDKKALIVYLNSLVEKAPNGIVQFIIDLFCGAGGTSEGIEQAQWNGIKNSAVIVGINHDKKALYSQAVNHPKAYYTFEDIQLANLAPVLSLTQELRSLFPNCPIIIWASLECTNHSNAKGGQSRDADSRTQAWDLNRYMTTLNPDGLWIENVKEFELWGPLIEQEKWKKDGKKVKISYSPGLPGSKEDLIFYQHKINHGEIGYCDLHFIKDKKRNILDFGPTWVTDKRFAGSYYRAWVAEIDTLGYHHQSRVLNAADFGTPQNRHRLFLLFMRKGWPIHFPEATHSKNGGSGFFPKQKHVPVKTCINFKVEGKNIFEKGHVRSPKTWVRLSDGLIKFVAGGKETYRKHRKSTPLIKISPADISFNEIIDEIKESKKNWIIKYMGNNEKTGSTAGKSIDEPSVTVPCGGRLALGEAAFLTKNYSSHNNTRQNAGQSIEIPCFTLMATRQAGALVKTSFILHYQGQSKAASIEQPSVTLMQQEKLGLIGVKYFISKAYKSGTKNSSVEEPCGTLTQVPKTDLVEVKGWIGDDQYSNIESSLEEPAPAITASRHHHYLYNPSWFGSGLSIEQPAMTIVARQDKAPIYMIHTEQGDKNVLIPVFESDDADIIKIKEFMALYNIYEITKRMLMIPELLKIQSFPDDYFLAGTATDKKKYIGNAVPPYVSKVLAESNYMVLLEFLTKEKVA